MGNAHEKYWDMESMPVSEFKAKCLQVVGDIQRTGSPLLLTLKGVPAAIILPAAAFFQPSRYLPVGAIPREIACPPREEWELVS
ncbi:MAG TPA: hypothetical protein VMI31_01910 [Fimbriimonadaceae bacterium]|nr:hypothetical protein [Fimbriimonadaceae bacterium]